MIKTEKQTGADGEKFVPVTFTTFCPKLIAMRKEFRDDAVASRSITFRLMPREPIELREAGVPLSINEEFRRQAQAIRNMLLRWRMEQEHAWGGVAAARRTRPDLVGPVLDAIADFGPLTVTQIEEARTKVARLAGS